jgi:hypothetical protein
VEAPAARLIDAWTEVPAYLRGNAKDPGLKPLCIWVAGMTKTDTEILSPSTSLRAQNDERRTEADFSAALRNDKQERQIRRFWLRQNDGKEGGRVWRITRGNRRSFGYGYAFAQDDKPLFTAYPSR